MDKDITIEVFEDLTSANARNRELGKRFGGDTYSSILELDEGYGLLVLTDGYYKVDDLGDTKKITVQTLQNKINKFLKNNSG